MLQMYAQWQEKKVAICVHEQQKIVISEQTHLYTTVVLVLMS